MSSNIKKHKLIKTLLTSNIAGCGCGKPNLSDVYEPTPKTKTQTPQIPQNPTPQPRSSSSSCDKNGSFTVDDDDDNEDQCTSTTISFNNNSSSQPSDSSESSNPKNTRFPSPKWTKIDSFAVVKESTDPYQDFRQSMLQMIVEKQIYSKEDLQELLSCFLELNSASHHDVIIQAFTQIWNDLNRESKKPIM